MMTNQLKIILASHGKFAVSALETVEMIAGKQPNMIALSLLEGESVEEMVIKYDQEIEKSPEKDYLILTDIFGGTPSNAALQLLFVEENVQIYSGFNLPLLLEIATTKEQSFKKIATLIQENWHSYLTDINLKIKERGRDD